MSDNSHNKNQGFGKYAYRSICNVVLIVVAVGIFAIEWIMRLNELQLRAYLGKGNWLMYVLYAIIIIICVKSFNGFKIGVNKISTLILSQVLGLVIAFFAECIVSILVVGQLAFFWTIVWSLFKVLLVQIIFFFVFTWIASILYRKIFPPHNMLMIYGDYNNNLALKMCARDDRYNIVDSIHFNEGMDEVCRRINEYNAVLVNDVPSEVRNKILKECFDQKKRVYFTPKIGDIFVKNSEDLNIFDTPIFFCRNMGMSIGQKFFKRFGDIIISLLGIIITSPIMAIAAITIKAYDHGPALYKQTRCTIDGKEFQIMKFRSMIVDAEADGVARLSTDNDSRITPIGKFIRATRIDELPQFFNILKGDMSIVGPRPERPEINRKYVEEVPEFAYRLRVKAGLTGYAQVYGKYNTTNYDKLKLDLIYVQKCSVLLDIQLILLTIRVIFTKEATEGIEEGQTTASSGK